MSDKNSFRSIISVLICIKYLVLRFVTTKEVMVNTFKIL